MSWTHSLYGIGVLGAVYGYYFFYASKRKPAAKAVEESASLDPEIDRRLLPNESLFASRVAERSMEELAAHVHALRGDDRLFVCRLFESALDRRALDWAVGQYPQSQTHRLLRGVQAHAGAWKARGHGASSEVGDEAFRKFEKRMALAEADLLEAAALDPADPTPHAMLVAVACHLDRGDHAIATHLNQAVARDREHYGAPALYLNYHCAPHWGGSNEQAIGFARQASAGAPAGSLRPMLVLEAHYWAFHYEAAFGKRKLGDAHVANPEVQREVLAAYHASIGNPVHRPTRRTNDLRNLAAWWFYMMRDRERCAHELAQIGNAFTDAWWQRLGRPEKQIAAVRAWVAGGKWKEVGW